MSIDYAELLTPILEEMKQGRMPWSPEWNDPRSRPMPFNVQTMKDDPNQTYRASNIINLWGTQMVKGYSTNAWITMVGLRQLGGKLIILPENDPKRADNKSGQKATPVIFSKPFVPKAQYEQLGDTQMYRNKSDGGVWEFNQVAISRPKISGYVFNLDQVEGLPEEYTGNQNLSFGSREDIESMFTETGIEERVGHDNSCYYIPQKDIVSMVSLEHFTSEDQWYKVRFHEFGHATGHKIRLDRDQTGKQGSEEYAFEELVAELTSAFMSARFGIPGGTARHANYLSHYIKYCEKNPKAIFQAATKAQAASEWLISHSSTLNQLEKAA